MAIAKHRAGGNGRPQQLLRKVFPPMLATLTEAPPANDALWSYELKYDGFRALVGLAEGELAMWSRNELDLAPRFPGVSAAVRKLKVGEAVLDGEIVALDEAGVPRFQLLQGGVNERIFIFDVLWLEGEDLRKKPYTERRAILEKLLRRTPAGVELAHKLEEPGVDAIKHAAAAGYEGIIAKRNTAPYEGRRSKEWLKVKAINQQELAVVGYTLSTASDRDIGALHLGVMGEDGEMQYAGKVGTVFSVKLRGQLLAQLEKDRVEKPMVKNALRSRDTTWVRPRLVAQVAFTEWTGDNRLRHPSFLGLRDDKSPSEVVRERPAAMAKDAKKPASKAKPPAKVTESKSAGSKKAAPAKKKPSAKPSAAKPPGTVILTHPERVLYPKSKITKQELADYYDAVSEPMIRALADRPLSLEHSNQGIGHASWFHQNLGREAPDWLPTVDTPTRTGTRGTVRHLVANTPEALRWLAQMSVLTVHSWSSRYPKLEQPDWVV
ncbi:MAG: ligase, partial [Acidobacteria bacterium]|nr:ligase [Acidobacteriota bacterium]